MLMELAVHCVQNLEKSLHCLGQETFIGSWVILRHRLLHCVQLVQAGMSFHLCIFSRFILKVGFKTSLLNSQNIFPSQRFKYNPMEGCVLMSYILWQVKNGWITTELFYGWLANHFALPTPPGRPVVLLVDGHSTHFDLEISKFCDMLLYCIPAHSSHITEPFDVGFNGLSKQA